MTEEDLSGLTGTASSAVTQALNKFVQSQKDSNKMVRKNGIDGLKKQLIESFKTAKSASALEFANDSLKFILKLALSSLNDPAEKCRELSADILKILLDNMTSWSDESTSAVILALNQRLGGREVKETSEEIRLQLYNLLVQLVEMKTSSQMHTFEIHLTELVALMQNAIADSYPEVKKVGCQCARLVANRLSKGNFHMQSETLVKTLLANIVHQHSRVRKDVVDCLCDVIMYGNNKSVTDACSHLAQRLFDQAGAVRAAVIRLVATWLLDLPDRYSFQHKLIPLLLTGFVDESIEIKETTESLWWDVGIKYERENEQDLKDKADFLNHVPDNYPSDLKDRRPNVGCRELIRLNASKILPGILNDIGDWVEATRIKSAELLHVMIWQAERNITQHLETVLQTLFRSCSETSPVIQTCLFNCSRLLGHFTDPSITLPIVFKSIRKMSVVNHGAVGILQGMLIGFGCTPAFARDKFDLVVETLVLLDQNSLTFDTKLQAKLLDTASSIFGIVEKINEPELRGKSDYLMFKIIFTISALTSDLDLKASASKSLGNLDPEITRNTFIPQLISEVKLNCDAWNDNSLEPLIFAKILTDWGLSDKILGEVVEILKKITNPNKDAQLRTRFILILPELIFPTSSQANDHRKTDSNAVQQCLDEVLTEMILPNLTWRAGRAASAVRMSATASLALIVDSSGEVSLNPATVDVLTKQVLACLDDDQKPTRLYACKIFSRLLGYRHADALSLDQLHKFYVEFIKRLDDQSDEIRVEVVNVFQAYFGCLTKSGTYDKLLYKAHLENIFENLLLYLDDTDHSFQLKILSLLKQASRLDASLMVELCEKVKNKHRSADFCNQLISYCKNNDI